MSAFSDQVLLQFLDDAFVQDLLANRLGLVPLLNLVCELEDVTLRGIPLVGVPGKEFAAPAFETRRTTGTDERIAPDSQRVKIDRTRPRSGRLSWVDVLLDVSLAVQFESQAVPLDTITSRSLLDKLGGVTSLADLRNKLTALYPSSVVDAFFRQLRLTSVEAFLRQPSLFLEFIGKPPPPFDPNDPANTRAIRLEVCVQTWSDLQVGQALQAAKLARSILENERNSLPDFKGGTIVTPFAFVVIFPDSAAVDGAIPGLTAAEIKTAIRNLFQAERMFAQFI